MPERRLSAAPHATSRRLVGSNRSCHRIQRIRCAVGCPARRAPECAQVVDTPPTSRVPPHLAPLEPPMARDVQHVWASERCGATPHISKTPNVGFLWYLAADVADEHRWADYRTRSSSSHASRLRPTCARCGACGALAFSAQSDLTSRSSPLQHRFCSSHIGRGGPGRELLVLLFSIHHALPLPIKLESTRVMVLSLSTCLNSAVWGARESTPQEAASRRTRAVGPAPRG
jgi:hypothetical protein